MKKIGIVADSLVQYIRFIEYDLILDPYSLEAKVKYHYISTNDYESISGIELSEFIFASDKLREMYHFFKKIESRVR